LRREDVPPQVLEKEREIYRAQAAAQGKPPAVQDKIAEGKLKDFYAQVCLLEQPFVRDQKLSVGQLVQERIAILKENIVVRRFARFRVGDEAAGAPAAE
jgi:elongation factor Ts